MIHVSTNCSQLPFIRSCRSKPRSACSTTAMEVGQPASLVQLDSMRGRQAGWLLEAQASRWCTGSTVAAKRQRQRGRCTHLSQTKTERTLEETRGARCRAIGGAESGQGGSQLIRLRSHRLQAHVTWRVLFGRPRPRGSIGGLARSIHPSIKLSFIRGLLFFSLVIQGVPGSRLQVIEVSFCCVRVTAM